MPFEVNGHRLTNGIDISFPSDRKVTCFGLPFNERKRVYQSGKHGFSCDTFTFAAHANMTHIEGSRHIASSDSLVQWPTDLLYSARLLNGSIDRDNSVHVADASQDESEAVIIKTGYLHQKLLEGNEIDLTGTNPPHLDPLLVHKILEWFPNCRILMVDLPSVDPEKDQGALKAHRRFFAGNNRFIVEMCCIPPELMTGNYLLSLNMIDFNSDASPCRPVLYSINQ